MWTIQYFGAVMVEKPFATIGAVAGWGISGESPFQFQGASKSTVTLQTTDDFDNAFQFAYGNKIIIWRDRTAVGAGGTIWFQSYVAQPQRVASGTRQNHQFTLYNWIGWAERIGFRQPYNQITTITAGGPIYTVNYTDDVCLGESPTEEPHDVAQQIIEILTSMNQRYNPTRWRSFGGAVDATKDLIIIGTIGVAGVPMPRNPMRCVVCYEALRECLKQVPDAMLATDYTTTPPTVSVTKLADMATATLTLPDVDPTKIFTSLSLKPRYDRQLNGVVVEYKTSGVVSGANVLSWSYDKYPLTADFDDPLVLSYIVELAGVRSSDAQTTVTTIPVNAANATDATRVAWWQAHDDRLKNVRIVPGSLKVDLTTVACVETRTGLPVDLTTFAWELLPGSGGLLPGMAVSTREVTITAKASWDRYHSLALVKTESENGQEIHARLKVCNLNTGGAAVVYTVNTLEEGGEVPPSGLAQYLYTAFTSLQHEGTISTVGQDIRGDVAIGQKLTLVTPGNVFANNLIQNVTGEIFKGVLTVEIGPPGVLGPSDIVEQLRVVRYVPNYKLPSGRSTGKPSGGSLAVMAEALAKENTIPGLAEPSLSTTSFVDGSGNLFLSKNNAQDISRNRAL